MPARPGATTFPGGVEFELNWCILSGTMKNGLRVLAAILLLGAFGFWAATGASRGWTKTSVPKKTLDEVTGIEGVTYEKKFVPGLDFLAAAVFVAGILAVPSFLFRNKKTGNPPSTPVKPIHP
jgi:hypothetical protein